MSSNVGGEDNNNNDDDDKNPLNEWISRKESQNVRQVREQFAEGRLPISYGAMNTDTTDDDDDDTNNNNNNNNEERGGNPQQGKNGTFGPLKDETQSSTTSTNTDDAIDATSTSLSRNTNNNKPNPYLNVVSRLAPSDLIAKFTSTASPRVQDAVRTTVLGLIGGLPQMAFETKTVATGERLASLMFQLQMTGYMFKNAEYRLSLAQSLGGSVDSRMFLPGGRDTEEEDEDAKAVREGRGRLRGRIKVRYGGGDGLEEVSEEVSEEDDDDAETNVGDEEDGRSASAASSPGMEVEVDAQAYMSELRGEVSRLRDELDATKQAKDEEIRKDLLMYMRTLPQQELKQLTGTMSPEVLEAMKGLVTAVLAGIGDDENEEGGGLENPLSAANAGNKIGPNTVTEQSGEALAQLCMWQLVVGFNLRELEVREEFGASMSNMLGGEVGSGGGGGDTGDDDGGVQFGPGALE